MDDSYTRQDRANWFQMASFVFSRKKGRILIKVKGMNHIAETAGSTKSILSMHICMEIVINLFFFFFDVIKI